MPSATLTSKGQVTVPKLVRDRLKIKTGDRLDFVFEGNRIVVQPGTRGLQSLRGILHQPGRKPVSSQQMDEAIARFHGRRR